jgi:hypothetical protein
LPLAGSTPRPTYNPLAMRPKYMSAHRLDRHES